jgi:signal transduction histidine kinase
MTSIEMQLAPFPPRSLVDDLDLVLGRLAGPEGGAQSVIASARARVADMLDGRDAGRDGEVVAALAFAADVIGGLSVERSWSREELETVAEAVARVVRLPAAAVVAGVCPPALRDPRLLELPPRLAIEAQLRLLFLAGVTEVSLWTRTPEGEVACSVYVGDGEPTAGARAEAGRVLGGVSELRRREHGFHGVPVIRWHRPHAALVFEASTDDDERALAYVREAATAVAPVLEKEVLLERSASREKSLVDSTERRLSRLAFDLHDGALQDLAVLAGDVHLFRDQLGRVLATDEHRDLLLGRVDDVQARLMAVDRDVRALARSVEAPTSAWRPLREVVRQEVGRFAARTDIRTTLDLDGDFALLTNSQRIALVRIVQEALANVREHSGATHVRVSVVGNRGYVRAEIVDNGQGFDVEETLLRAAQSGRLGLVGMSERVRLLGGTFDVESKPGGPTTIAVALPEWRPASAGNLVTEIDQEEARLS